MPSEAVLSPGAQYQGEPTTAEFLLPHYIAAEKQHLLRYQQLAQAEDALEENGDQLAEARALLEWAESLIASDNGDFTGWLRDYAAFAEKYPQENEEE